MKKLMILAAALLLVGSAFAAPALNAGRLFVQPNATFATGAPLTTDNDSSCDIAVTPAATLLLPYFEVDVKSPQTSAVTTMFAITNTSAVPQIAHVTVWTDWSFPVLDFNLYLTGYDVQTVNLYDILSRGVIPATGYAIPNYNETAYAGPMSVQPDVTSAGFINLNNPNFDNANALATCASLPGPILGSLLSAVQSALTTGVYGSCSGKVGFAHDNAIGYITIDVANSCTQSLPTNTDYYSTEILFDNVLIGDYFRVNPTSTTGNFAGGNPMVHIRAIPEGGRAGSTPAGQTAGNFTNFTYTFYDRYTPTGARDIDRRQPLPGVFAARYVSSPFDTNLAMWREGYIRDVGTAPSCSTTLTSTGAATGRSIYGSNRFIPISDLIRFDEQENPSIGGCQVSPCETASYYTPETISASVADTDYFPPDFTGTEDSGGWMYLNMNNGGANAYSTARETSQNWVEIQMTAEGRYGVDFDAAYLYNGCSPSPAITAPGGQTAIPTLPNENP